MWEYAAVFFYLDFRMDGLGWVAGALRLKELAGEGPVGGMVKRN
jgi:hypothetical protein